MTHVRDAEQSAALRELTRKSAEYGLDYRLGLNVAGLVTLPKE